LRAFLGGGLAGFFFHRFFIFFAGVGWALNFGFIFFPRLGGVFSPKFSFGKKKNKAFLFFSPKKTFFSLPPHQKKTPCFFPFLWEHFFKKMPKKRGKKGFFTKKKHPH